MMQGDSAEDERMIQWALEVTNLTEYRDREVSRLSVDSVSVYGLQWLFVREQRLCFLMSRPHIWISGIRLKSCSLLKLNQNFGITIIMVLHDINQAIAYSDNVIGMKDAKCWWKSEPEDVITEESIRELYGIELGVTMVDGQKFVLAVWGRNCTRHYKK